jgi:transposase
VPPLNRTRIANLLKDGQTQKSVARKIGMSQNHVHNVANKMKKNLALKNCPGQGRPRVSTLQDDRRLLQKVKRDRTLGSRQLSAEWVLSNGKTLSRSTVRRRLLKPGYNSYNAKPKPVRNVDQKKKLIALAASHLDWISDDWKHVIWSDEAHYELFNRKNR